MWAQRAIEPKNVGFGSSQDLYILELNAQLNPKMLVL